jgi:predicted phage terminase large subunit-like protein
VVVPAGLTEAEELELLALLEAEHGGESLSAFIARVAPREPPPPHIRDLLVPHLERARREPVRLCVAMPPRHAKSVTIMRWLIWRLQRDSALLSAYVSYGAEQAETQSRWMRRLAVDAGLELSNDTNAVNLWRTRQGGGLVATGINGAITGKGIKGALVIDDPHKDRREAESETMRSMVWEQFQGTFYNRLEDEASVVVVQTRWHQEDLIGRLMRGDTGEEWTLVEMPAVRDPVTNEPADERERGDAIALWPERFPLERLRTIRSTSGEYNWWSLYQQRPRPRGLSLFRDPARFLLTDFKVDGFRLVWAVDPAATAKTSSDYSVAVLLACRGFGDTAEVYVLDVIRVQEEIPVFVRRVAALARAKRCPVVAEAVAGFKAVPQMLRDIAPGLRVDEANVSGAGDKFVRAQAWAAAWNAGRVRVPMDAPWADAYIGEHLAFTGLGDRHDDQVDASVHGHSWLYRPMAPVRRGAVSSAF